MKRPLRSALWLAVILIGNGGCAGLAGGQDQPVRSSGGFADPPGWAFPAGSVPATTGTAGMVSTTDPVATSVGAGILRAGGNAVDAAVATHFALAVVNPEAGNIGGGGFLLVRTASGETAMLDFREKAPLAATRDMFLDANGQLTDRSVVGHLAAGVPGSVAGMWEAHRRFGSLPWATLIEPAIRLADELTVHERLAASLSDYASRLARYPATASVFLPEGRPPRLGERFSQPDLAATLRRIAADGADGFYAGRTAELIEAEMQRGGGIITRADLAGYSAVWRDPIRFEYREHTVITVPPPSSGGATLAEILNILEGYDLAAAGHHSVRHIHLWAEAVKRAFADRNTYLADPDFVAQPLERMISDEYASERRAGIRETATPSTDIAPGLGPAGGVAVLREGEHTTHFSVVDRQGMAVAVTTTINSLYGNLVTVEGAGFLLNNEMDDFAAQPGASNQFGLVQGEANAVAPGKRMLSAMTPTIVLGPDDNVRLVTGSPGGPTIITTVAQIISNVIDFGMTAADATAAPRVHHQHLPDVLQFEANGLSAAIVDSLRALGHTVTARGGHSGDTQTIEIVGGVRAAAADPRRGGAAEEE